ncbi:MAG: hypothetical protein LBQ66_16160 [Planctomycetaceae bacterium]|nr:hypothetical protein [Planctomycetaceae bacterium]
MVNRSFFRPLLAFALSGRELLGAIFHFLPRWGVKKSPQRKTANTVCRIVIKVRNVGRTSRIGKARVSHGSISVTKL